MPYQSPDWTYRQQFTRQELLGDPKLIPIKDSFAFDLQQALDLPPSPASPSSTTASALPGLQQGSIPETSCAWPKPSMSAVLNRGASHRRFDMSPVNKAQSQCLQLCSDVTATCDGIAEKMSEYTSLVKHLPHGYVTLAKEVLGACHVLSCIHTGLSDAARLGQALPLDMVAVMEKKFRSAQACLRSLDHVVSKLPESDRKGTMGRMRRGLGKMFGDNGIEKVMPGVIRSHEDLKIGALMFQWKLGSERMANDLGIGYIGLSAALEAATGQPFQRPGSVTASEGRGPGYAAEGIPTLQQHHSVEDHRAMAYQHGLSLGAKAGQIYPDGASSHGGGSVNGDSSALVSGLGASHDSPMTKYTSSTASSYDCRGRQGKRLPNTNGLYTFEETAESALGAIIEDIMALELASANVLRVGSTPFDMPHMNPSSKTDSDKPNIGAILVSAIRAGDHRVVEQLLDRGVSPDTGPDAHALNDSISNRDAETVRLLLLYGVDPSAADKEGQSPLAVACSKAQLDIAIALLKYGADPNLESREGLDSPLATAVSSAHVRLAHALLMYGGQPNQMTGDGNTLLIESIGKKTPKVLTDMLLNYGAGPNEKNREGKTAMFEALSNGRADIVSSLIEHGANPNLPGPKHMLWPATHHPECLRILLANAADFKKTPGIMELATSINNIESIRILLKAGVDPNAKKDGVYTPLCTAIRDDRADIFELLIRSGADPNVPASEYPAFKCITHHRQHFLPALLAAGANLDTPRGIIETAVASKNPKALKWLLDRGADPNDKCPKGRTPLTTAIRENNIDFVDTLLAHGANPNVRGQDWPVCMAVQYPEILERILAVLPEPRAFKGVMEMAVVANQLESVKLLRAAGVSVEDRNGGVFSPLTTAIREYRTDIVAFLTGEGGADVNAPGEHLPIVKALRRCQAEHTEIIDMLLDKGADPNKMYRGWNGIMQALENGDAEMLRKLTHKAGVNLEVKDELGRTVTEIAISRRWEEAVNILLSSKTKS